MSELPLGWVSVPLDAVSNLIRGVTYKKDESVDHSEEGYLPVLRANNIQNGKLQFDDLVFVLEHNIKDIQKVKKGDIVVAMSSGSKRLVGKSGIAETDFNGGFGAFCGVLRPSQHLNSKYVGLYTLTKEYSDLVSSLSKGVNINNLKPDHFSEINIPIAPLNEQIRIADKLDSVLAKVEATQTRLEKIPTLLKRFRQAVLAAATSGELTREWRIEKSFTEWSSVLLKDICNSISDGDHQAPPQTESGVPFLVISNVSIGTLDLSKVTRYVPIEYYEGLKGFRKPARNDILYTVTGSFGIPVIVNTTEDFCFQRHIAIIKPRHDKINYKFLTLVLGAPEILRHANEVATGTAQKTVSLNNLRKFEIPMPSEDEQQEIVRRVESLFALADTVEKQYLAAKKNIDRLTQSLLAKAFRGELVPQDPNDEPAAELLKRIQAERLARPSPKRKRSEPA